MFEKNDEINRYLDARGKVVLNACPGSGKTTSIAYKLQSLTKETIESVSNFSGVACLSFTNIAKDEINQKYKSFSGKFITYPHLVSTIDSFINQYIVLPNYHLLYPEITRPTILDKQNILDEFELKFLFRYKIGKRPIRFSYFPSSIQLTKNNSFLSNGNKPNLTGSSLNEFNNYCIALKKWQFKNGFLTNNDTAYLAIQILEKFPEIGKSLIKRFPLIILDEAQDTSEIHFAIFDKLIKLGLKNIEIIGDPYQSLYEWREARPDLFIERYDNSENWISCDYTFCRRSEQNIINTYSILRDSNKTINSTLTDITNKITVFKYEIGKEINIVKEFIELSKPYKENHIVVRGRKLLNELLGFSNTKDYWKIDIPILLISAKQHLLKNEIKIAVNTIRKLISRIKYPELKYEDQRKKEIELQKDYQLNSKIIEFINNLPSFDLSLKDWNSETEDFINAFFKLDTKLDFKLKQKQGKATYETSIAELYNTKNIENQFPISTIHQVKGKTFDTLLLFLSNNSSGQKISINDCVKPTEFPNDSKRMIYVAMSRPRNLLAIAVPKETDNNELKKIFGNEIIINE